MSQIEQIDTVIVGGGQAGLAMSYHLSQRGREHIILERQRVAERWRTERWDSLRFQLPNRWLEMPGKPYVGGAPEGFVHHSEVVRLIVNYAADIKAPVRTGIEVTNLSQPEGTSIYKLETTKGCIEARHVVIATGPFQRPTIPGFSTTIPASIYQTDAAHYRNPGQLPPGAVLVVGSANSGCQIADELLRGGRRVLLAISRHNRVPRRYRGQDVIWWYSNLGYFDITIDRFPGGRYPPPIIITGVNGGYDLDPRHLCHAGATLVGRVLGAYDGKLALGEDGNELLAAGDTGYAAFIATADKFAANHQQNFDILSMEAMAPAPPARVESIDGLSLSEENIKSIIWAVGYGYDYDWLKLPIVDHNGAPIQQRGVTAFPGIYFLGLHWMHTWRSAILPFVGQDAAYLADHMDRVGAD